MALPEGSGVFLSRNSEGGQAGEANVSFAEGQPALAWGSVLGTRSLAVAHGPPTAAGHLRAPDLQMFLRTPNAERCSLAWPCSTPPPSSLGRASMPVPGHHLLTLLSGSHQGRSGPLIGSHPSGRSWKGSGPA